MSTQALVLTDNAANKVRQLRDSEGNEALMLRVYVTGGGCSGFSYGFNFAENANEILDGLLQLRAVKKIKNLSLKILYSTQAFNTFKCLMILIVWIKWMPMEFCKKQGNMIMAMQ